MNKIIILIAAMAMSSYSAAALHIRDLDGDWSNGHEGVYDDVLDITWLADGNLASTNTFSVTGIDLQGPLIGFMSWSTAETFVDAANSYNGSGYLAVDSWRLPTASGCLGFNCGNSTAASEDEFGYHFYQNFGASVGNSILEGTKTYNINLFNNVKTFGYWLGTEQTEDTAYTFDVSPTSGGGNQDWDFKWNTLNVWLVADGDHGASVVPIPTTVWLFLSALGGLLGVKRYRAT